MRPHCWSERIWMTSLLLALSIFARFLKYVSIAQSHSFPSSFVLFTSNTFLPWEGLGEGNYLKALETAVLQQSEPHMPIRIPELNRKQTSLNEQILLFILIEKGGKLEKKRLKDWFHCKSVQTDSKTAVLGSRVYLTHSQPNSLIFKTWLLTVEAWDQAKIHCQ